VKRRTTDDITFIARCLKKETSLAGEEQIQILLQNFPGLQEEPECLLIADAGLPGEENFNALTAFVKLHCRFEKENLL
jgi:hypothetical protein